MSKTLDTSRSLVMTRFKTVLGHNIGAGQPVTVVAEPSGRGEIDKALAERLFAGGLIAYAEDHRPTPVETPAQERARLAAEALRDSDSNEITPTDDLVTWQADDAETGKRAGQKVTNSDLLAIAKREGALIESDDNKPDMIAKIMTHRASKAGTASILDTADLTGASDAEPGADAHGAAGEGASDAG